MHNNNIGHIFLVAAAAIGGGILLQPAAAAEFSILDIAERALALADLDITQDDDGSFTFILL